MGDRSITFFHNAAGDDRSPGVYMHWNGHETADWIKAAAGRMRAGDTAYSAARFCGYCHERIPGNLSLGLLPAPEKMTAEYLASFDGYNHGDAGVFAVNVDTGAVVNYRPHREPEEFAVDLAKG